MKLRIKLMMAGVYSKKDELLNILDIIITLAILLSLVFICLNIKLIAIWIITKLAISLTQLGLVYKLIATGIGGKILISLTLIILAGIIFWLGLCSQF